MWDSPIAADIVKSDKLKTLFGSAENVVPGSSTAPLPMVQPAFSITGDYPSG